MTQRIQLSRKKGWRQPAGTLRVCRPSKLGNPYRVAEYGRDEAVQRYAKDFWSKTEADRHAIVAQVRQARYVGCWCRLDERCHGDFLIEMSAR
jgi:hypothetical protein